MDLFHVFPTDGYGAFYDFQLPVKGNQFEIGRGDLGDQAHLQGPLAFDGCQIFIPFLTCCPGLGAEKVVFPRNGTAQGRFGVGNDRRLVMVRPFVITAQTEGEVRKIFGQCRAVAITQLLDFGNGGLHVFVVGQCFSDQLLQEGVGIDLPPLQVCHGHGVDGRPVPENVLGQAELGRRAIFFHGTCRK